MNERYKRPIRNMEQKPIAELTGMEEARAGAGSSRPFLTQVDHCMLLEASRRVQLLPGVPRWVIWKPPPGWAGEEVAGILQENKSALDLVMPFP